MTTPEKCERLKSRVRFLESIIRATRARLVEVANHLPLRHERTREALSDLDDSLAEALRMPS